MVTLIVEAIFVAVFAKAVIAYVRTRDRLQRDVMLIFSTFAGLFVLSLLREVWGDPPRAVGVVIAAWWLGQPYWTLRVISQLRLIPRWITWAAGAGWVGTALPVLTVSGGRSTPLMLAVLVVFVSSEVTAAGYLVAEARKRRGSSRRRLWCAAAATAAFAAAIVVVGVRVALPGAAAVISAVSQALFFLSAMGYLLAFMPPRWLRQVWSARAAYGLIRRLLIESPGHSPAEVWQQYVRTVRQAASADAVAVLIPGPDGLLVEASCAASDGCDFSGLDAAGLPELMRFRYTIDVEAPRERHRATPLAVELAARGAARFVTAVPLSSHPGTADGDGALVLLNGHRSLFEDDDAALLGELAVQAAVLAHQGRLTAQLAASAEAANAASRAKSDFLANMSHELRTPLNAIIGFSELMAGEELDGDNRIVPADWIDHIRTGGRHLLGLINDVLDLSKIEAGRIELFPEPLDLPIVIDDAVAALRPLITQNGLRLTTAVPPLTISADRVRFRQVLDNLLSNAIKFTPAGGQVFVSARRTGGQIQVAVTDTGPGIAPDDQTRVFAEFTQVGEVHMRKGGTGLGLPLARRLAQAHGGDITLESEPGHGTRFTITLPTPAPAVEPVDAEPANLLAATAIARLGGGILVIEDDPAAAQLLRTHLHRVGYHVTVAATGEEGLAVARTLGPDLILLDLILPGLDGRRVLQLLKDDRQLRHIPVAIISVADDREVGLALGAVDYFVKPVNHDALLAWLVRHGFIPPLSDQAVNVLVIDDDPATVAVVTETLQRHQIRVVDANNGLDGLRLARSHHFDLIICDLLMPGLDGFTVIAALHDDPATHHVPVLVLTAQDLTQSDKARLAGKALAIITKSETTLADLHEWMQHITEPAAIHH